MWGHIYMRKRENNEKKNAFQYVFRSLLSRGGGVYLNSRTPLRDLHTPPGPTPLQDHPPRPTPPPRNQHPSPVNRMTNRCKSITLAKTSFRPVKRQTIKEHFRLRLMWLSLKKKNRELHFLAAWLRLWHTYIHCTVPEHVSVMILHPWPHSQHTLLTLSVAR